VIYYEIIDPRNKNKLKSNNDIVMESFNKFSKSIKTRVVSESSKTIENTPRSPNKKAILHSVVVAKNWKKK
jgi:hypothetical protein